MTAFHIAKNMLQILLYPDKSPYGNEFIESLCVTEREVHTTVRTVVFVYLSSEGASPGGVVDTEDVSFERHPVVYEGIILRNSVVFHSSEMHFLRLAVQMEGASRSVMALGIKPAAHDGSAQYQLAFAVVMQGLGSYAYEDIWLSIDVPVALDIVPVAVHLVHLLWYIFPLEST